jgi:hypothetical protein
MNVRRIAEEEQEDVLGTVPQTFFYAFITGLGLATGFLLLNKLAKAKVTLGVNQNG